MKFKDQFGDFYQNHQEEFQKMMQEFRDNFTFRYDDQWKKEMKMALKANEEHIKAIQKDREAPIKAQKDAMKLAKKASDEGMMKAHEEGMKAQKEAMKVQAEIFKEMKVRHEEMTAKAVKQQKLGDRRHAQAVRVHPPAARRGGR